MKKIILLLLLAMCTKNEPEVVQDFTYVDLDIDRMEQIITLMPIILKKSQEFQARYGNQNLSDEEYNREYYKYLYSEKAFADRLGEGGFPTPDSFEEFYNEMINIYLLVLGNPNAVSTALSNIPSHEREVSVLTLRAAKEPNNTSIANNLKKYEYELSSYKNIIIVNSFADKLNAFNQ